MTWSRRRQAAGRRGEEPRTRSLTSSRRAARARHRARGAAGRQAHRVAVAALRRREVADRDRVPVFADADQAFAVLRAGRGRGGAGRRQHRALPVAAARLPVARPSSSSSPISGARWRSPTCSTASAWPATASRGCCRGACQTASSQRQRSSGSSRVPRARAAANRAADASPGSRRSPDCARIAPSAPRRGREQRHRGVSAPPRRERGTAARPAAPGRIPCGPGRAERHHPGGVGLDRGGVGGGVPSTVTAAPAGSGCRLRSPSARRRR